MMPVLKPATSPSLNPFCTSTLPQSGSLLLTQQLCLLQANCTPPPPPAILTKYALALVQCFFLSMSHAGRCSYTWTAVDGGGGARAGGAHGELGHGVCVDGAFHAGKL
jgi:hypothetical protein